MTEYNPKFSLRLPDGPESQWLFKSLGNPGFQKAIEELTAKYEAKEESVKNWRDSFRSRNQLEAGGVKMLIKDFIPEGVTFLGALAGQGKTQLALSLCKSFTTGAPFLGKYKPMGDYPVLYLIPESSGAAFRMRLEAFGIPDDENKFLCRTVSEGKILRLDDPITLEAVKQMKPIVILDTMIRFSEAADENSAAENRVIANNILDLRAAGAPAVIALHHSVKTFATGEITLESCLRGSGDIAALADAVYALRRDTFLYDSKNGPEELEVVCVKDRDLKNPPQPFRVALRYKKEDGTLASYIDETGDIQIVHPEAVIAETERKFTKLVTEDSSISREEISKELGLSIYAARRIAKKLGWNRTTGRYGVWTFGPATKPESPAAMIKRQKEEAAKKAEPTTETESTLFSKQDQSCAAE